jgi:hypothetical protein
MVNYSQTSDSDSCQPNFSPVETISLVNITKYKIRDPIHWSCC